MKKNNKKIIFILFIPIILVLIIFLWVNFLLSLGKKADEDINTVDGDIQFGTIINSKKDNDKYFLYSDDKKIYYLKGLKPSDIYIVRSRINVVDDNVNKVALEKFNDGVYSFRNDDNSIFIQNVLYSVYNISPSIYALKTQLDIVEEDNKYDTYLYDSVVCNKEAESYLYYTDRFGRKIYLDGVANIYVTYNGTKYELKDILIENDSISDNVYYMFRNSANTTIRYYASEKNVIEGLNYENVRIANIFSDNEQYYKIKCLTQ